ncbi:hypothetical protein ACFP9V_04340 [Deinococcus radiopugnans]|uniref:Primase-polymerase (Primpol)-like protein n=1 Tax=Deinococcus radiopugnans ATCC 19172 TaxID=585398 RepID=A0A5C4Y7C3_9DEIO|nr:hypothetical protein [Deinococcus radiopugnans]MBB6017785.1 primase-polymerase (primpol)-like protein [Deinococcus radiopugnans ATCC 19172]TNM71416.1 hypothetical protein FHR04_07625 [Deinococcus radiopugnans ATCC 19172]
MTPGQVAQLEAGWPNALRSMRAYLPYELRRRASGRWGKVPCRWAGRLYPVNALDGRFHLTFEDALSLLGAGRCDGIGVVLGPQLNLGGVPLVGLDLDDVVTRGRPLPGALELLAPLASYTEFSISGQGLHVVVAGRLPPAGRRGHVAGIGVELIDCGYLAMTGKRLPGTPADVAPHPEALLALHRQLIQVTSPAARACPVPNDLDDEAVLRRARSARNGARFTDLFDHGDLSTHGNDPSRADLALLAHLRWYTHDPDQLRRLWARSALHRPERWTRRATRDGLDYAAATITRALALGQPHSTEENP